MRASLLLLVFAFNQHVLNRGLSNEGEPRIILWRKILNWEGGIGFRPAEWRAFRISGARGFSLCLRLEFRQMTVLNKEVELLSEHFMKQFVGRL